MLESFKNANNDMVGNLKNAFTYLCALYVYSQTLFPDYTFQAVTCLISVLPPEMHSINLIMVIF